MDRHWERVFTRISLRSSFKVFPLEETVSWYGKVHFPGMIELLREENPDILVTIWPYSLEFALNPKLRKAIKELGIKTYL